VTAGTFDRADHFFHVVAACSKLIGDQCTSNDRRIVLYAPVTSR